MSKRESLPAERLSKNTKLWLREHTNEGPGKEYWYDLTLGYYPDGRLGEIFIRSNDPAVVVYDALAMAISVGLQHGAPFDSYRKHLEFQGKPGPAGLAVDGAAWRSKVSSPLDMIAKWVGDHQKFEMKK